MILRKLEVGLETYGENKGKYVGRAEFGSKHGSVQVILTPEHCQRVLELCADAIVETSSEVAKAMVAPVIEQQKSIGSI